MVILLQELAEREPYRVGSVLPGSVVISAAERDALVEVARAALAMAEAYSICTGPPGTSLPPTRVHPVIAEELYAALQPVGLGGWTRR